RRLRLTRKRRARILIAGILHGQAVGHDSSSERLKACLPKSHPARAFPAGFGSPARVILDSVTAARLEKASNHRAGKSRSDRRRMERAARLFLLLHDERSSSCPSQTRKSPRSCDSRGG